MSLHLEDVLTLRTKQYPLSLDLEDVLTLQTKLYPLSLDPENVSTLQTKQYLCLRAGNLLNRSSLIRSFAYFAQIK